MLSGQFVCYLHLLESCLGRRAATLEALTGCFWSLDLRIEV